MRHSKLIIFSKTKHNNNFNNNYDIFKNLTNVTTLTAVQTLISWCLTALTFTQLQIDIDQSADSDDVTQLHG